MLINWLLLDNRNIVFEQYGATRVYSGVAQVVGKFTEDFIAAATSSFRCPEAMVEVIWASSAVDKNVVLLSNDINRIDRTGQLFNGLNVSGEKWAYIHSGLIADGSFKAMPALDTDQQMGWYGSALVGDGAGDFSTEPFLQLTHEARSYSALLIAGDSVYDEFPVDFTVTFTHAGGPTVINVVGNTERVYSAAFDFINDVTVIKLEISKWSAPNTIVKIVQFSGALIELYKSGDIVEINVLEETNSDTGVVPVGNVSANEMDLALLNTDRRFSFGNTESPYNTSLRSGRKISLWFGFILPVGSGDQTGDVPGYIVETVGSDKIGYMPYGIYWSKDWISSHDSQITTTTAYDVAYLLSQKDFLKSDNYTGTVESVVNDVLTAALEDVPDLQWQVSADTAALLFDNVDFAPKSYLEVLKEIAAATLSFTYVNRDGLLIVGALLEAATPLESWQLIDLSIYYDFKSAPKLDELVNVIRVGYTKSTVGAPLTEIYAADEIFEIPAGGVLEFFILWRPSPVDVTTVGVTLTQVIGEPLLTNSESYAYGALLTVAGDSGDTFQISATGTPFELEENTETTEEDAASVALYGAREFALVGNRLITSDIEARIAASDLLTRYGELRQDGEIEWPASTLLSVGDTLEVVEFKSDTVETKSNFIVKRQNIKYTGAMQGRLEMRRG